MQLAETVNPSPPLKAPVIKVHPLPVLSTRMQ